MSLERMQQRALEVAGLYDKLNKHERGVSWRESDYIAGLVGDVGDLSKIAMAAQGLREMDDIDAKFEHELHDIMWSALVLAAKRNIQIESGFMRTMDQLEAKIQAKLPTG